MLLCLNAGLRSGHRTSSNDVTTNTNTNANAAHADASADADAETDDSKLSSLIDIL